ncbi:UDP-glycosyltransferase 72E1 [Hibiscus syriacus]|uniref:UDP-glycosyltransferase 72E1 n=1 Tax=Hibiscus syriacus TaxID=106335 RepID=A0A6A3AAV6_HIBSY|nr:UDP-glycosyltransferase 72E1 [Hibiscus syriacus]
MRETRPAFSSALSALSFAPTVLIVDLFGCEHMEVADEFKIQKLVYITMNAWFLALTLYLPILHESVKGEYVDEKNVLFIPGCKPLLPEDVVDPMLSRSDQQYWEYLNMAIKTRMADGILLNTWEELEPTTLAALRDHKLWGGISKVPVYPVGPLVPPTRPINSNKTELFDWLEKQPSESVLYISFGSGGLLSNEQMRELALGLELSQQKFIWVVRPPAESNDGSFFTTGNSSNDDEGVESYLPEGFLDRTKGVGFIISDWGPQVEILRHESVGGFLSHCGWNSILESIINGVPLIAWPLYAEQRMNATLLAEEVRIAVRPKTLPWKGNRGKRGDKDDAENVNGG